MADDYVSSLSAQTGPWRIGTLHRARIIGYSALDGLLQLSLKQSLLNEKIMQVDDVELGQVIKVSGVNNMNLE